MLILSRRTDETIRFPQLGISVSIVSVKGNRVQVGVDAPPEIQVLRKELESALEKDSAPPYASANKICSGAAIQPSSDKARHEFRNRLNQATLGVSLAQKQLAAGRAEEAERSLATALGRLADLEKSAWQGVATSLDPSRLKAIAFQHNRQNDSSASRSTDDFQACMDVLLVEDEQNEQALMKTLLEMEGYRVHAASNGFEALKIIKETSPQFVLLDMNMPECDGRQTFASIRRMPEFDELPIYAVSGSSPDSMGLSIGPGGLDDWFPKPLNAKRLVESMKNRKLATCR